MSDYNDILENGFDQGFDPDQNEYNFDASNESGFPIPLQINCLLPYGLFKVTFGAFGMTVLFDDGQEELDLSGDFHGWIDLLRDMAMDADSEDDSDEI